MSRNIYLPVGSPHEWIWKPFEIIPGKAPYIVFLFFGTIWIEGTEHNWILEPYDVPIGCGGIHIRAEDSLLAARVLIVYR